MKLESYYHIEEEREIGGDVTRSSLMIVVFGLAALLVASCARSTPTPTSDVQSGAGTPIQVETPTAAAETGSGAGALTRLETPLANPRTTPTPAGAPMVGQSEPVVDSRAREEQRLREILEEFPERMKIWIDQDTIVYLLPRDPHDLEGELGAVVQDLPTRTVKNYELVTDSDGQASIGLYAERTPNSPEGRAAALRLEQDPRVTEAALKLLTTVERWSKQCCIAL